MSNVTYLVVLAVLWFRGWNVVPFGYVPDIAYYVATMFFMVLGLFCYRYETDLPFWRVKMKPFYFILAGVLLSMIPANLYYEQSFTQSLVTYRIHYLWLLVPLLFRMVPTEKEIVKTTFILTLLMWGVYILRLVNRDWIVMDEETLERLEESKRTLYITGFTTAAIPLYYYLGRLREAFNARYLLPILICYGYIFTMQNRSLLFPTTIFLGLTFLMLRSQYRIVLASVMVVAAVFFIFNTSNTWEFLISDSYEVVNDKDYNRNIALAYFLTSNEHPINYVLGNGLISDNVSDLMATNRQLGIYNSDVGFVGFWNQFGLIPVVAFIWLLGYALIKKSIPYSMKLWSAQILICSLTISYFGQAAEIFFFSLFIYLLYYHRELATYGEEDEEMICEEISESAGGEPILL